MFNSYDERMYCENQRVHRNAIDPGDVVLTSLREYIVLTNTSDESCWEYFDPKDGYFHIVDPKDCEWVVRGQKGKDGKLLKIVDI